MSGLAPWLGPETAGILADPSCVDELTRIHGSPVNVVLPETFTGNVADFRRVLSERLLDYRICYAHKANPARSFTEAALRAGIDADITSPAELAQALAAGFPPERIEATGPKGEAMLRLLLTYPGLTINVDNLWELTTLGELAGQGVPVLLRLCAGRRTSRFGLAPAQFSDAFDVIARQPDRLELRGISFHLDTGDLAEKMNAVAAALRLIEAAYERGLTPGVLNIGGGYRQRFIADPDGFYAYVEELKRGLIGAGPSMAWGGYTFGYRIDRDGVVRGTPVFHRYTGTRAGADLLAELLDAGLPGGRSVAETIRENLLQLWLEPGKALVDHAGFTVSTVQFVKPTADGSLLVNLDLSRDKLTAADQEIMLDPIPVYRQEPAGPPCEVYLAGNLCLERDMISNHLVRLPALPRPGDLLVFSNTAAYQMDLSAAEALMFPRPPKVAAVRRDGALHWLPDTGEMPCFTSTSPN